MAAAGDDEVSELRGKLRAASRPDPGSMRLPYSKARSSRTQFLSPLNIKKFLQAARSKFRWARTKYSNFLLPVLPVTADAKIAEREVIEHSRVAVRRTSEEK